MDTDQWKILEILKNHGPKVYEQGEYSLIKLKDGIELHFERGALVNVVNSLKSNERLPMLENLLEQVKAYFIEMFPQMKNYKFESSEALIHEALILAKYIKSPLQEDGMLDKIARIFVDKYPYLVDKEFSSLELIRHVLVLMEDEKLRAAKKKK
ncbi:MAG: hypothetical protein HQM11_08660 [SAR324 cluster bacterium]|nr:hypothetical protein [SAR324 cluster bacterium]